MSKNVYVVRKVSGYSFLFWATRYMYVCMYVCTYVSVSALIAFSTPVLRTVISQWMTSCILPQWLAEGCDLPLIPFIKILKSLGLWMFCEKGSYFENSLDIFCKFILLHRFSSRFKFNKYHTSKIRTWDYICCSRDGVDKVSCLLLNSYWPLGPSYRDSMLLWNILNYLRNHIASWSRRFGSISESIRIISCSLSK